MSGRRAACKCPRRRGRRMGPHACATRIRGAAREPRSVHCHSRTSIFACLGALRVPGRYLQGERVVRVAGTCAQGAWRTSLHALHRTSPHFYRAVNAIDMHMGHPRVPSCDLAHLQPILSSVQNLHAQAPSSLVETHKYLNLLVACLLAPRTMDVQRERLTATI